VNFFASLEAIVTAKSHIPGAANFAATRGLRSGNCCGMEPTARNSPKPAPTTRESILTEAAIEFSKKRFEVSGLPARSGLPMPKVGL